MPKNFSGSAKDEVEDTLRLSVPFLYRHGYFRGFRAGTVTWTSGFGAQKRSVGIEVEARDGGGYLRIHYTQTDNGTGEKKDFDYRVLLASTPCRFGGVRYWFRCPCSRDGAPCGRRVGTLYKNGDYFACRHCYDLTYGSRKLNRAYLRASGFGVILNDQKIDELEKSIKRRTYAGKPTRKQRRLQRLYAQTARYAQDFRPGAL